MMDSMRLRFVLLLTGEFLGLLTEGSAEGGLRHGPHAT